MGRDLLIILSEKSNICEGGVGVEASDGVAGVLGENIPCQVEHFHYGLCRGRRLKRMVSLDSNWHSSLKIKRTEIKARLSLFK